ncbi:MAG: transport-associated protein [Acidobacteria bacterium]|nr:MAG: transport-associated protein [Acidobacteriota bacterium]
MKLFTKFIAFSLLMMAFSAMTLNGQSFSSSGSARSIEDQVRKKILMLPRYEIFDAIGYQVNGDTVTLTGKVRNSVNKKDAEKAVSRIAGVSRVVNEIEILPVGGYDESIRVRLYEKIAGSGSLSRYMWENDPSIRLIVDRGHVSIEGFVSTRGDYNSINILAQGIPGVFSVTNNLAIDKERVR